jgi:hypothetical protein
MSSESLTTFRNIDDEYDEKRSRASRGTTNQTVPTTNNDLAQKRQQIKSSKAKNNPGLFNIWSNSVAQNAISQKTRENSQTDEG